MRVRVGRVFGRCIKMRDPGNGGKLRQSALGDIGGQCADDDRMLALLDLHPEFPHLIGEKSGKIMLSLAGGQAARIGYGGGVDAGIG